MSVSLRLLEKAKPLWDKMLSHPFLEEVGRGTLSPKAFNLWLAQDYIFVREAFRFLGVLELKSPDYRISLVLADAFGALKKELLMFEEYSGQKGLSLEVEPAQVCRAYTDFLITTAISKDFEEAFAVLWCAEKAYLDSWSVAKGFAVDENPYKTFIDNWTSDAFKGYVSWLEDTLNRLLEGKPEREIGSVEEAFLRATRYEYLFWDMVYGKDGL
jgi:thiaminase/transcriptional activator TenA